MLVLKDEDKLDGLLSLIQQELVMLPKVICMETPEIIQK